MTHIRGLLVLMSRAAGILPIARGWEFSVTPYDGVLEIVRPFLDIGIIDFITDEHNDVQIALEHGKCLLGLGFSLRLLFGAVNGRRNDPEIVALNAQTVVLGSFKRFVHSSILSLLTQMSQR
jgi:hypothetical protein